MADHVEIAPSPEKNLPILRVELRQKETKGIDGIKPGSDLVLQVKGKLKSIELREPYSESSDKYTGCIEIECDSVQVEKPADGENPFSEMAD